MQLIEAELRRRLPVGENARRLFHGRGRTFPGYQDLLIDSYGPLLWVTLFAERPPVWITELSQRLRDLLPHCQCIVVQRRDRSKDSLEIVYGQLPADPWAFEDGLRYRLRPRMGQNIGFFIDMRVGRQLVRARAAHKKVLNLFAYSCSFSVAAVAGGARQVTNVDMNRNALELGRENHQLNRLDLRGVSFLPHEIFRSFGRLRKLGPFDLIICDPPFAQGRSFTAESHWPKLVARLGPLLAPGGEVVACLNAPHLETDYLRRLFADEIPRLRERACLSAGEDFPEAEALRGLSVLHFVADSGN